MQGIAILVGVRPENVLSHLRQVDCFESLKAGNENVKVVLIRMQIQEARADQNPLQWMGDRAFGVALISRQSLKIHTKLIQPSLPLLSLALSSVALPSFALSRPTSHPWA